MRFKAEREMSKTIAEFMETTTDELIEVVDSLIELAKYRNIINCESITINVKKLPPAYALEKIKDILERSNDSSKQREVEARAACITSDFEYLVIRTKRKYLACLKNGTMTKSELKGWVSSDLLAINRWQWFRQTPCITLDIRKAALVSLAKELA